MVSALLKYRSGQSLAELLVAVGIGIIIFLGIGMLIAPSLRSTSQVENTQTAAALGKELLDNAHVFAEQNWHNIDSLATTSANTYFLDTMMIPYAVVTGTESVLPDAVATSGLLTYWKFDESTGTVAYDFSGNNYTGALTASPVATSSCKAARCLSFNGATSYVESPNLVNVPTSVTLAAWVKPNAAGGVVFSELGQVAINSGFHDAQMEVETNNTIKVCVRTVTPSEVCVVAGSGIVYGQWYHVIMRYDTTNTTLTGYVNGTKGGSVVTAKNSPGNLYYALGPMDTNNGGNASYFSGLIDDVRIYNRALSDAEIKTLANAKVYTRSFYIDNVMRSSATNFIDPGGTLYDPSTKKITVVYGSLGATSSLSQYLTRSQSAVLDQTDWSGGLFSGTFATGTNQYATSTANIVTTSPAGSITIISSSSQTGFVRSAHNSPDSSCSLTFSQNTLGDLIVVSVEWDSQTATISSFFDTSGNSYSRAVNTAGGGRSLEIWYAENVNGSNGNTVTVQITGPTPGECVADEYTKVASSSLFSSGNTTGGLGNLLSVDNDVPEKDSVIYVAGVMGPAGIPLSPGAGYTSRDSLNGGKMLTEDTFATSVSTYTATENGVGSDQWRIGIISFKSLVAATSTNIASGTIDSAIFDTNVSSGAQPNSIMWLGSLPAGTEVDFQIAVATSSGGPWTFIGCNTGVCSTNTVYGPTQPLVPTALDYANHNNARYFRYRAILYATSSTAPRVDDISLNWSQ